MQIEALVYFNELVRSRSIRQAAETLGVSPMAVSRQLENLGPADRTRRAASP